MKLKKFRKKVEFFTESLTDFEFDMNFEFDTKKPYCNVELFCDSLMTWYVALGCKKGDNENIYILNGERTIGIANEERLYKWMWHEAKHRILEYKHGWKR